MIASTTFTIDGYDTTETKGLVRGIIVRSPTISQGILGGLKNIIGGKIGAYTAMCEQTRFKPTTTWWPMRGPWVPMPLLGFDTMPLRSSHEVAPSRCFATELRWLSPNGSREQNVGPYAVDDFAKLEIRTHSPIRRRLGAPLAHA